MTSPQFFDSKRNSQTATERKLTPAENQIYQLWLAIQKDKSLPPSACPFLTTQLSFNDDISKLAAWAFQHIYSKPIVKENNKEEEREIHGMLHMVRVAIYISVFANLFKKQQIVTVNFHSDDEKLETVTTQTTNPETSVKVDFHSAEGKTQTIAVETDELLTDENIKLLQIAALLHDAARKGEERDYWEKESGLFIYFFLTHVLQIKHEKAKLIAEAVVNKDAKESFQELIKNDQGEFIWQQGPARPKNILQKIMHDSDALDIHRARDAFDAYFLDFYTEHQNTAMNELAKLICEARSLIESHGDGRYTRDPNIKSLFEHADAYPAVLKTIFQDHFQVLPRMFANGKLLSDAQLQQPVLDTTPYDAKKGMTAENLSAALREGKVYSRTVPTPSAIRKKESSTGSNYPDETFAGTEVRKASRRKDVPTRTLKPDRATKHGNPKRATSLLGWGSPPFGAAGFLIVNPPLTSIHSVAHLDRNTGIGKLRRKPLFFEEKQTESKGKENHINKIQKEIQEFMNLQKRGGTIVRPNKKSITFPSHSEALMDITDFDAIYFTQDRTFCNEGQLPHPNAAKLEAFFLQREYENQTKKRLPIFEYSSTHDLIKEFKSPDENEVIQMWVDICSKYMEKEVLGLHTTLANQTLDHIKLMAVYGSAEHSYETQKGISSLDSNYPPDWIAKINKALELRRQEIISQKPPEAQELLKKYMSEEANLDDTDFFLRLMHCPEALELKEMRIKIHQELVSKLSAFKETDAYSAVICTVLDWGETSGSKCNPLFTNKEEYKTQDEEKYFDDPYLKCYEIAKKIGLPDVEKEYQKIATRVCNTLLDQSVKLNTFSPIKIETPRDARMNLDKVICYAIAFDCFDDSSDKIALMSIPHFLHAKRYDPVMLDDILSKALNNPQLKPIDLPPRKIKKWNEIVEAAKKKISQKLEEKTKQGTNSPDDKPVAPKKLLEKINAIQAKLFGSQLEQKVYPEWEAVADYVEDNIKPDNKAELVDKLSALIAQFDKLQNPQEQMACVKQLEDTVKQMALVDSKSSPRQYTSPIYNSVSFEELQSKLNQLHRVIENQLQHRH